jgi:hypothetical protein
LAAAQQWTASEHGLYTFELALEGRRRRIPVVLRAQ